MEPMGIFHWNDDSERICYYHNGKVIDFVTWKKECYIKPAYELLGRDDNKVMTFLKYLFNEKKVSLGLVHPKGRSEHAEKALTKEFIKKLFDSKFDMCCMPYVVAGFLLGVKV